MKAKKPNYFDDVFHSIINFDKYKDFALETVGKTLKYLVLTVLIFTLISSGAMVIKLTKSIPNVTQYLETNIPEFSFKENTLNIPQTEPIEIEQQDSSRMMIIDTNKQEESDSQKYENKIKLYDSGIVLLQDKIIMKSKATTALNILYYKDLTAIYNITEFNKQDIITFLRSTNMIYVMMAIFVVTFIYLFITSLTTVLLEAIVLGILCRIFAMICRLKMQFRSAFGLAVHALTLPMVLNLIYILITIFTAFRIKYFNWMYNGISYIYVITAIFIIRSDLIKQQMELTKIMSEQEKVRMELEENKRKEEEEQEKEELKKKDKQKEKSKGKGKIDKEPEGSKA